MKYKLSKQRKEPIPHYRKITARGVRGMLENADRIKVVKSLVNFIERVTKKERPSKAEVEVLPEVVRALREFITVQNS